MTKKYYYSGVFADGNPETQLLKHVKSASGSPKCSAHNIPQS